ncbi:MAG: M48 family metallopeptidase [Chitinophagales bacterium]
MVSATTIFYFIVGFIILEYLISQVLGYLNSQTWQVQLPAAIRDLYEEDAYHKARDYHKANRRLGLISGIISTAFILLVLFVDGFAWLDNLLRQYTENPIYLALMFFGTFSVLSSIISLPFSLYSTFVVEEKFGFNKTTLGTFFVDMIKGALLGGLIGGLLLALIVWLYQFVGEWFWLYAWIVFSAVSLFFAAFATTLIMPLFNKFTPLENGELRTAIESYSEKVNFSLKNIFIMDGSKRSAKANAFFSGLGGQKSIVLYDTLVEQQSTEELVAVLAHEVGHYKKKHIPQTMVISMLNTGIMLFLLGLVLNQPVFSEALGASESSFHIGMLVFSFLFAPVSTITGILMNLFSRKNEFEADAYAAETYKAAPMITALKKLSVTNLSNPTPHPAYVFVHYSHPPLLQRLEALERQV